MKRWQIYMFLALVLLSLTGCAAGDGSYTGAPEQRPMEHDSPRP